MNGKYEKKTPHEMLMKFKQNYGDGNNDFTMKHNIKNVSFREPSVILDNEGVKTMKSLQKKRNL